MMRISALIMFLLAAGASGTSVHAQTAAEPTLDRARLEQRFESVGTLLEKSTAARQVEASGDAAAREKRSRALEIYRRARTAFEAGQLEDASALLPQAAALMFEAVRASAPQDVVGPKARADYAARLESVKALHDALRRVAREKPDINGMAETSRDIEEHVQEAERLAAAGRFDTGRAALERAYLLAKAAISSFRSGDTLVRELRFETSEDEFKYEIDRNDTHQMLINVLLQGKPRTATQKSFIERASQLRVQANAAAAQADHSRAVKLLEDSTRELIRAIRSAGVFIPG